VQTQEADEKRHQTEENVVKQAATQLQKKNERHTWHANKEKQTATEPITAEKCKILKEKL
jgi:hypothetical protein